MVVHELIVAAAAKEGMIRIEAAITKKIEHALNDLFIFFPSHTTETFDDIEKSADISSPDSQPRG